MPSNDFRKNSSGYSDPTAHQAYKNIMQEENEQRKRARALLGVLHYIIDAAGFDVIGYIRLRDRKTGREWR